MKKLKSGNYYLDGVGLVKIVVTAKDSKVTLPSGTKVDLPDDEADLKVIAAFVASLLSGGGEKPEEPAETEPAAEEAPTEPDPTMAAADVPPEEEEEPMKPVDSRTRLRAAAPTSSTDADDRFDVLTNYRVVLPKGQYRGKSTDALMHEIIRAVMPNASMSATDSKDRGYVRATYNQAMQLHADRQANNTDAIDGSDGSIITSDSDTEIIDAVLADWSRIHPTRRSAQTA